MHRKFVEAVAVVAAAMALVSPAFAGGAPAGCNGAVLVVTLGTAQNVCPDLVITDAGKLAVAAAARERGYQACKPAANAKVIKDIAVAADAVGGDKAQAIQVWCLFQKQYFGEKGFVAPR